MDEAGAELEVISQTDLATASRKGLDEALELAEQGRMPSVNALESRVGSLLPT